MAAKSCDLISDALRKIAGIKEERRMEENGGEREGRRNADLCERCT